MKSPSDTTLNRLCREMVFQRDGGRCVLCGSTAGPEWAHCFYGRHPPVVWDPEFSMVLCHACHAKFTRRFGAKNAWEIEMRNRFGFERWLEMQREAAMIAPRPDREAIAAKLRGMLEKTS